jgi:hypothetical protein
VQQAWSVYVTCPLLIIPLLLLLQSPTYRHTPGAPGAANGLISEVFGVKSGPALVRSNCILAIAAGVCAPLVALR